MNRDDDRAGALLLLLMFGVTVLVAVIVAWGIFRLGKFSARHLAQRHRDHRLEQAKRRAALKG